VTSPAARIWVEDDLLRAGYTQCLNVLLPARALGASDKIVFFGVLSFAWQDGAAWPSIEMLSARVGLSRATVLRSVSELKRFALLKVRRRGQGLVNFYEIPRISQAILERIGAVEPDEPDEPDDEPTADEDLVEIEDLTEAKGFTPLSNLILAARGLDAADKLVYVGLKSFAWRGKARCRLKMRTLARRIGMSERSVETHVARLRAAGLVTRRRRGLGRCNVYTLVRMHPAILEAIQEPRYVAPPAVDNRFDALLGRCPVCHARLTEPAPALVAILKCQRCGSGQAVAGAASVQNGKVETSASEVADLPFSNGGDASSGGRRPAVPEVAALPRHEENAIEEDSIEHDGGRPPDDVDRPAARAWRLALRELSGRVSVAALETWFRGSVGLAWQADRFTVGVPHRFAQEWIDLRFREPAEEALARVVGRRLELVVELTAPSRIVPAPTGGRRGGWAARRRAIPAEQRPNGQPEVDPDPRDPE
jgi:DNA-binding transcriptional ArsR family regulator